MKLKINISLWNSALLAFLLAGTDVAIATEGSKVVCTATMTGDVPLVTVSGAGQQTGIESSFLITNTSATDTLEITSIESYGMDGVRLVRLTPQSGPDLEKETAGFFTWKVKPRQLVRFPHDYTMIYPDAAKGIKGTNPELVRWYNVVFEGKNADPRNSFISPPIVTTGMVERTENLTVNPPSHPVLSRLRNECKFMF